jgi:two-component system probable response regulator PhcQ
MPGMDGAEFLSIVKERHPEVALILLTGYASLEATMKAVNNGEIYRFFTKPWDEYQLKLAIRSAIEKYDLEAENRRLLKTVKRQAVELRSLEVKYRRLRKKNWKRS